MKVILGVRGLLDVLQHPQGVRDPIKHAIHGFVHFYIPEPENGPACSFEIAGPGFILRALEMLAAIYLDDELHLETGKISNMLLNGLLPPELEAQRPLAEHVPDFALGVGGVSA